MTYEELRREAAKKGLVLAKPKQRANPSTYDDRPISKIVVTAMLISGIPVDDKLAMVTGVGTEGTLRNKLNRNSFTLTQLAKILKYCGGALVVRYPDGSEQELDFEIERRGKDERGNRKD